MPMDNWYDLAIRELSDLTDPGKEILAEAEQALCEPAAEAEETPEPPPVDGSARVDEDFTGA